MNEFLFSDNFITFIAALLGVVAVLLTARQNIWCWPIGILNTILSAYIYWNQTLPAEACLQLFYFAMAVYGWIIWKKLEKHNFAIVTRNTNIENVRLVSLSCILGLVIGFGFFQLTHSFSAYLDAELTSFSLAANYLSARKKLDNWVYWFFINAISIGFYSYKELYWFAILFAFYLLIAIRGYLEWGNSIKKV